MGTYSRRNGMYNDPAIGEAISGLAKAFAPPSGTDLYGYSHAALAQQQLAQRAKFAGLDPNSPEFKSMADQFAIGEGHNPNYYDRDTQNAVSRLNNTDDNTRALKQTGMHESGETTRTMLAPVGEGQTRFVPPSLADQFKVDPVQRGTTKLNQGESATLADGRVLQGNAKPLTSTEWEAQQAERLRGSGQIDDNMLRAKVMGSTPVEEVYDDKGVPTNVYRTDSVGKHPIQKNTVGQIDPATGQMVYTTTTAAGGKPLPENAAKAVLAANEMEKPAQRIEAMIDKGALPGDIGDYYLRKSTNSVTAPFTMSQMSADSQQAMSDLESLTTLYLYYKSGANRTPSEDEVQRAIVVPVPGEDPTVTSNKMQTIKDRIQFLRDVAGPKGPVPSAPGAPAGLPTPPDATPALNAAPAAPAAPTTLSPAEQTELDALRKKHGVVK